MLCGEAAAICACGGIREIEVVELDHVIPEVAEFSPDPDHWYNKCAERYYDIQVLAANQPGWDE